MRNSSSVFLLSGDQELGREELEAKARSLRETVSRGSVFRVADGSTEQVILAILGLDGHCRRIELVPEGVELDPPDSEPHELNGPTKWAIFTSGTTGEPKPVLHTLESLSSSVRPSDGSRRWGLVYDPHRLAGLAVVLQALESESILVEARTGTMGDRVQLMKSAGVTALSATPTFWRQILQTGRTSGWQLERITLGGEVSDQRTLDSLAAEFPAARITHIFAATETGVAFAVGDGREGFPRSYLSSPPRGVRLSIREGILWVHSPSSSVAGADGFVSTDDSVEVRGDRVVFLGRSSGMVNVGGSNVFPEQVENILREHPLIADAVVFARRNPFSGHILLAKVTLVRTAVLEVEPREVRAWIASRLPKHMVPAQIEIVDELQSSSNWKAVRS